MDWMQVFTLVTGVIYIVLEIRQKNFMWVVGIATSLAAMWVFFRQGLYASFGLNTYYLITSFIGLWHWSRDRKRLSDEQQADDVIHLNRLNVRVAALSAILAIVGIFALAHLMELVENPMSYLDATVTVLSAIATWWLVKCYLQQWWLWIAADFLSTVLCASQGMWWMTALYAAYTLSAVYGYIHWKRKGQYVI
ncbi:MAG: nicotinamide mononucleotide transporter [Bacteroidales bacterium]|nr:nicotinamide mononucleotide transporter [Bacteroidales bacterium]